MLFPLLFFLFLFGRRMLPLCFWFWSLFSRSLLQLVGGWSSLCLLYGHCLVWSGCFAVCPGLLLLLVPPVQWFLFLCRCCWFDLLCRVLWWPSFHSYCSLLSFVWVLCCLLFLSFCGVGGFFWPLGCYPLLSGGFHHSLSSLVFPPVLLWWWCCSFLFSGPCWVSLPVLWCILGLRWSHCWLGGSVQGSVLFLVFPACETHISGCPYILWLFLRGVSRLFLRVCTPLCPWILPGHWCFLPIAPVVGLWRPQLGIFPFLQGTVSSIGGICSWRDRELTSVLFGSWRLAGTWWDRAVPSGETWRALYRCIVGIAGIKTNSHHCLLHLIPDELITTVIYLGFIVCLFFSTLLFTWTYSFLHLTYCCAPGFVYYYGHCVFECCVNWTLLRNCVYLNWYYCLYMLGIHCVFMIYCSLQRGLHWFMEHGILNGACGC